MKADITTRRDIEVLLIRFYEKVKTDDTIGFIFTKEIPINWEHHLPLIADFWETILLDNPVYKKNAMEVHYHVNNKIPLQKIYFDTWLFLFTTTIDELYEGKIATLAKTRAKSIGAIMEIKMRDINHKKK